MARSSYCLFSTCFCILLLLDFPANAVSQSIVRYLPGFGLLPFELETGYVTVDDANGVEFFYYFFKSENNPIKDPLLFYFTGGPGCSALSSIMTEMGPLAFKIDKYNGSLPTLIAKSDSWTKVSNIVFLDAPVNTGFSYSRRSSQTFVSSDTISAKHSHTFIRKWLLDHPDFLSNPLYLAGESYAGIVVPITVQYISDGIEAGEKPVINLKGYLLGNPITYRNLEENSQIPFAYGMGLISYEFFKSAKKNCRGNYVNVDPSNVQCRQDLQTFTELTKGIYQHDILDHVCSHNTRANTIIRDRSLLRKNLLSNIISLPPPKDLELWCLEYKYLLLYYWANDYRVQAALNVRKGMVEEWVRCKYPDLPYVYNVESSIGYHLYLSKKGYRTLIYSGDHDMTVPFMSTQAWIRSLKSSISDEWRQWLVDDQVAGYTRTYSNNLTYATVKGAGHTAPEYKPAECFAMIKRWLSYEPL